MSSYYVRIRPQLNGTNAMHKDDCPFLPDIENRLYLGEFRSCEEAFTEAKFYFPEASGCYFCATESSKIRNQLWLDYILLYKNL